MFQTTLCQIKLFSKGVEGFIQKRIAYNECRQQKAPLTYLFSNLESGISVSFSLLPSKLLSLPLRKTQKSFRQIISEIFPQHFQAAFWQRIMTPCCSTLKEKIIYLEDLSKTENSCVSKIGLLVPSKYLVKTGIHCEVVSVLGDCGHSQYLLHNCDQSYVSLVKFCATIFCTKGKKYPQCLICETKNSQLDLIRL